LAGGTIEGNDISCFESFGGDFGTDNTGNTEFATDNGGMRGLTAFVSNNSV